MKHLAILILLLLNFGCTAITDPLTGKTSTHFDQAKLDAWWSDPKTKATVSTLENIGLQIGLNALKANVKDPGMLDAISYGQRTIEAVNSSQGSLTSTSIAWGAPPPVANSITTAVVNAQAQGIPQSVAKEAIARGLDQASAQATATTSP